MKKLSYLLVITLFLFSCNNTETENNNETSDSTEVVENVNVLIDIEKVTEKVRNWRGGAFLKNVTANNGNISVIYVTDFNDYKSTYPVITTTEEDYKKQMGKAFLIDKMLAELPVKILKDFSDAQSVSLTIPFEGTQYKVNITKKDIEDFSGKTFSEIVENYSENYADKYVFDEAGRTEFVNKFVNK